MVMIMDSYFKGILQGFFLGSFSVFCHLSFILFQSHFSHHDVMLVPCEIHPSKQYFQTESITVSLSFAKKVSCVMHVYEFSPSRLKERLRTKKMQKTLVNGLPQF